MGFCFSYKAMNYIFIYLNILRNASPLSYKMKRAPTWDLDPLLSTKPITENEGKRHLSSHTASNFRRPT